jgi:hypothetical protein
MSSIRPPAATEYAKHALAHPTYNRESLSLGFEEMIYSDVLDMFFQSPNNRPTSKQTVGRLAFTLERVDGDDEDD